MNRREMLTGLTGIAATFGVTGTISAIESDPKPLMLVLTLPGHVSEECTRKCRETLQEFCDKHGLPPCVVLSSGVTLEAIVDPRNSEVA